MIAATQAPSGASGLPGPAAPMTQRLDKAAHQFEAMLLQELLKPLTAPPESGTGEREEGSLGGSSASGPLEGFGVQALAEHLANSGALGFAKQIERSLQHRAALLTDEPTGQSHGAAPTQKMNVSSHVPANPADKPGQGERP